jgi:TolA-binding protein
MADRDDMALDPLLADALRAERAEVDAIAGRLTGARERVLEGVLARVLRDGVAPPAAAVRPRRVTPRRAAIAVAAASALLGAGVGFAVGRGTRGPARPETSTAAVVPVHADAGPHPQRLPTATDAAPPSREPAAAIPDAPPARRRAGSRADARRELDEPLLIDQARAALRRRLLDDAMSALREHERRYPRGQLVEEREVLLIEALLMAGRGDDARARIERYQREFPDGLLREHVRSLDRAPDGSSVPE